MSGKSATFENDVLKQIFNAVGIANLTDNAASGLLTHLYLAFHTADPTDAGSQNANEASYPGYARVAVIRTTAGFVVSGSQVNLAANADFPQATGATTQLLTHWSVGVASSGATKILYSGTVTPNIQMANGVIPRLTTATSITEG